MFCKYCGSQLSDDAAFCSKCGNPVGQPGNVQGTAAQPVQPSQRQNANAQMEEVGEKAKEFAQKGYSAAKSAAGFVSGKVNDLKASYMETNRMEREGAMQPEAYADGKPRFLQWQMIMLEAILTVMGLTFFMPLMESSYGIELKPSNIVFSAFEFLGFDIDIKVAAVDRITITVLYIGIIVMLVFVVLSYIKRKSRVAAMGILTGLDCLSLLISFAYMFQEDADRAAGLYILFICSLGLAAALIVIKRGKKGTGQING